MANILVAGARGGVGRQVVKELIARNHNVRSLFRDKTRLDSFDGRPNEIFVADARDRAALNNSCKNVEVVISTLGASLQLALTKDKGNYWAVDYQANKNLLEVAAQAGVRKFIYVSTFGAETMKGVAYFDAHAAFEQELKKSELDYAILRPTGIFYIFAEFIKLARRGIIPLIGDGSARTNPVAEADLARLCVDAIDANWKEQDIGGPENFTRREIAEMCFQALGKKPRFIRYPVGVIKTMIQPVRWFDRRLYEFLAFGVLVNTVDVIAPAMGTNKLENYLRHLTAGD